MPTLEQLRETAQVATTTIEEFRRTWKKEDRAGKKEEFEVFDKASEALTDAVAGIEAFEATEQRSNIAEAAEQRAKEGTGRRTQDEGRRVENDLETTKATDAKELRNTAYGKWFTADDMSMTEPERRALSQTPMVAGGALSPDNEFVASLIQAVDDAVFIRRLATTTPLTNADTVGRPSLENDPADPVWTSEIATGDEDSTMSFGKRELAPHPLAKRIKVSKKLLRTAAINPEALVRERLAYTIATTQENAFLTGDGASQPLGVFTASADGISTGRDVSGSNTATAVKADTLIDVQQALKGNYWPRAQWIFHRTIITDIRKLKDGNGQYLWQPGIQAGVPGTILAMPFNTSEFAPNTKTANLYVGILADFSFYWIVDALNMTIQRLDELYAETNQTGFISRMESDGMPVLEEAFSRMQMGA